MTTSIDVTLYGHPALSEVRGRAVHDLQRLGRTLTGDVDVQVYRTIWTPRGMQPATACQATVEQVILAALQTKSIESRRSIRSITYRRPIIDGLDTLTVRFVMCSDLLLLV